MAEATLWFASALLSEGWASDVRLDVRDGRIDRITRGVAPGSRDVRHGIGLPGLPNLHSHAFQRAMAGPTEVRGPAGDSFWTGRDLMYHFVERLGPDEVEAVAAMAFMEMLESGFTRVGEFHYLHHQVDGRAFANIAEMAERIAAVADATGIGLTLLPVFYAHAGFSGTDPTPGSGGSSTPRTAILRPRRAVRAIECRDVESAGASAGLSFPASMGGVPRKLLERSRARGAPAGRELAVMRAELDEVYDGCRQVRPATA